MHATIVGAGRLGSALALRSIARGHATRVLYRTSAALEPRLLQAGVVFEPILDARASAIDLAILAAPARADPIKEEMIESFLVTLPASTTIASAVSYAGAPHNVWGKRRRYLQFMCSPAVATLAQDSVVLALDGDKETQSQFAAWLGHPPTAIAERREFEHLTGLLMATTVHLQTLSLFLGRSGRVSSAVERSVASATLTEAALLLSLFEGSPDSALNSCATPGGRTLEMTANYRRAIAAATNELGEDDTCT